MDKKDEETHAMDKPKPLEVVSDGDLSEIKKDPIWKTWLEKKEDPKTPTPEEHEPTPVEEAEQEAEEQTETVVGGGVLNNALHLIGLSYKSWLAKKARQTRIDRKQEWGDKSMIGRAGDIDQKTGRYWWEVVTAEEERKKREAKEKTRGGPRTYAVRRHLQLVREREQNKREQEEEQAEANVSDANKADYFVEEIKANIIYHDKVFPLIGMVAGQVARGVGQAGKKVGGKLLQDIGDVSQGMMQQEEEEQ